MKTHRIMLVATLALAFVAGAFAAERVKSGPQVGEKVPGPFHPLNVNGESAGEKACLFCKHGQAPVAMVFAREVTPALTQMIKQLDTATGKHSDASMGSFVVFLSDAESLKKELEGLAKSENLKNITLSIDNPAGPTGYNVDKTADVTVVLYRSRTVKANHSFAKGELKEKNIDAIVADLTKILKAD